MASTTRSRPSPACTTSPSHHDQKTAITGSDLLKYRLVQHSLEADFDRLRMTVAKNSYQQAVHNLVEQRFEAANGQMRSTFEAVIVQVAASRGFTSTKQGDGGPALAYLIDQGHLPERDGGAFIRGLWWITHTNGPHPGTSDAGEAYFRVQAITSAVRYLIDRFLPRQ